MYINGLNSAEALKALSQPASTGTAKEAGMGESTFGTEIKDEKDVNFNKNPFNLYGHDISNFAKFKGKDKYDAMNATNKATHEVNQAYQKFQKQYPGVNIEFPEPPNPANYGKRREGFQAYMQDLERWQNACNQAIDLAVEEQNAKKPQEEMIPPEDEMPKTPAPEEPKEPEKPKTPAETKNKPPVNIKLPNTLSPEGVEKFLKEFGAKRPPKEPSGDLIDLIDPEKIKDAFNEQNKKNTDPYDCDPGFHWKPVNKKLL